MKKWLSLLLVLTLATSLFAGITSALAEGTPSEIKVWTKDRHDEEFMLKLVEKFNQENEGKIKIVYEVYSDNYASVVDTAFSVGEEPDLLVTTTGNIATIYTDKLVDLTPYITDEFLADQFGDMGIFVEGVNKYGDKIVTLPNTGTTTRLVVNMDILARVGYDRAPATLAELVEYTKKITEELSGEGIYGFALPLKNPTSGLQRGIHLAPVLSGAGINLGFDYKAGAYDFTAYKGMLEALKEIFVNEMAFPGCESLDIDPLRTQFADGKIAMYMTYNHSEWGVYTTQFPSDVNWQYAPLVSEDGNVVGSQNLSAGTWYAMTEKCADKDAAWKVMEALYDKEVQAEYHSLGLGVTIRPAVAAIATPPESIAKVPYIAIQPSDKIWPPAPLGFAPEGNDWGKDFGEYIFGVTDDLDGMITALNERYNTAYEAAIATGVTTKIQYAEFDAADPAGTAK